MVKYPAGLAELQRYGLLLDGTICGVFIVARDEMSGRYLYVKNRFSYQRR
jgi:hypothetical protein